MLYSILKVLVRLAAKIFCRKIIINNRELLKEKGPMILACSHPNSFLDAVLMDILFKKPIWSLTRGDAFLNKKITRLFYKLKMLPVYRPSEGVENLSENYKTFDACIELFKRHQIVLIFSEGLCMNEWHLRSLKKGTARLAYKCQQENIPLKILPVGLNYSSFKRFGKNLFVNFGNIFTANDFDENLSDGAWNQVFNNTLQQELRPLVFEIDKKDKTKQKELLRIQPSLLTKILLAVPAAIGWLAHAPLYMPIKYWVFKKYSKSVHVDSMLIVIPLFSYPFYLLFITLILFFTLNTWWVFFVFIIFPFTAWSYVQMKEQLDK
ncbi:MAG TPA: 1-acyl-sn-glycerol-3-phosphate acyltransferase [Chitinophagaceae bacterium]|jgi:1-acyl-sn-glycerol-3-phosphate acyltransferase|nr:1-acyl-sn-glycerol-3-phosphate acyltransferase [Chitinophagaceae bacterium]